MIGAAPAIVYPQGAERLVCVAAVPGETAACDCGRPLLTPFLEGTLTGSLTLDYVRCRCGAHVVLTITATPP